LIYGAVAVNGDFVPVFRRGKGGSLRRRRAGRLRACSRGGPPRVQLLGRL